MNVEAISDKLKNDPDLIIKVLVHLGFDEDRIHYDPRKNCIYAPRPYDDADNPKGFLLYTDSLRWMYTTRAGKGNLFSLAMELKEWSFPQALSGISKWIGIKDSNIQIILPFGGFFKRLIKDFDDYDEPLPAYSESALPPSNSISYQFLKDGISLQVQERWGVRYDHETDAILIPIIDQYGHLVGCKSRNNDPHCDHNHRWWAYLEYNKNNVLFGVYQNYMNIMKKDKVIVLESEKAPMQAESFGVNCCTAIGGHIISRSQARQIRSLGVKDIILAFDEGIDEEDILAQCQQLSTNTPFYTPQISYIFDRENKYLPKGSKCAPTDLGKKVLKGLMKDCLFKYEENKDE